MMEQRGIQALQNQNVIPPMEYVNVGMATMGQNVTNVLMAFSLPPNLDHPQQFAQNVVAILKEPPMMNAMLILVIVAVKMDTRESNVTNAQLDISTQTQVQLFQFAAVSFHLNKLIKM